MERLTHKRKSGMKTGYWSLNKKQELVDRLAMYEDREDAKDTNVPGKWIPCSERLPEESDYYMACIYDEVMNKYYCRSEWFAYNCNYIGELKWIGLKIYEKVIAWMPLPEPYKQNDEGAEG